MAEPHFKSLRTPDETIRLPGVTEERGTDRPGGLTVGRTVQEPGWRWSTHVRPVIGGDWCKARHVGIVLSGRWGALLEDGTVLEFGPDDVYDIPPGHDGYTIGHQPCVLIEWSGPARLRRLSGRIARRRSTVPHEPYAALLRFAERRAGKACRFVAASMSVRWSRWARTFGVWPCMKRRASWRWQGRTRSQSEITRTVSLTSGLVFEDRGTHHLKGLCGQWRLFAYVADAQAQPR
jgi:hypothetical protein